MNLEAQYLLKVQSSRVLIYVFVFLLLIGCAVNQPEDGITLSMQEEAVLGNSALPMLIQKTGGPYQDRELRLYVDAVGQRMANQVTQKAGPFSFTILNDSIPKAYALPGHHIAISRGLLQNLTSEAEIAALLGHGIAHITAKHSIRNLEISTSDRAEILIDNSSGARIRPSGIKALVNRLLETPFTSVQENEADKLAIDYMVTAGYDPIAIIRLQQLFDAQKEAGNNDSWSSGFFSKHPFAERLLAENQRYIDEQYPDSHKDKKKDQGFPLTILNLSHSIQGFATYDQARLLEKEGQLPEAISLYHQALLEAPDEPLILTALGLAYLRNDDLVPAKRYLLKAVSLQGEYYRSRLALGYVYQQKQQIVKAREHLEIGFKLYPTLEGGFMLAEAREKTDDFSGAISLYREVVKMDAVGKLGRSAAIRLKALGE